MHEPICKFNLSLKRQGCRQFTEILLTWPHFVLIHLSLKWNKQRIMATSACTHKLTVYSVIPLGTTYPAEVKLALREFE